MPAYNGARTLPQTVRDIPKRLVREIILVDNHSKDNTVALARKLGLTVFTHRTNRGYGGSQKTCYKQALARHADIVVMLHADYQYDSSLIGELVRPILLGKRDIMFGSRIRTSREALASGMPLVKYLLNRLFCLMENMILGVNFSEHFSGFRAYRRSVLETLPIKHFSNDYVFDQEFMICAIACGFRIGEIPVPIRYFSEASSIQFLRGTKFLLETLKTLFAFLLYKAHLYTSPVFSYFIGGRRP